MLSSLAAAALAVRPGSAPTWPPTRTAAPSPTGTTRVSPPAMRAGPGPPAPFGTGGAPWLPFRTVAVNSRIRMTGTFGVLRLTLQPGGYRWRFVHAAGAPFTDHG